MPNPSDTFPAGVPAPAAGTYQCSATGCTHSFVASLAGAPLPSAHHPGAGWRHVTTPGSGSPTRPRSPQKRPAPGGPNKPA
jgi:hypothetical protein